MVKDFPIQDPKLRDISGSYCEVTEIPPNK